jgi:hypothetical protein
VTRGDADAALSEDARERIRRVSRGALALGGLERELLDPIEPRTMLGRNGARRPSRRRARPLRARPSRAALGEVQAFAAREPLGTLRDFLLDETTRRERGCRSARDRASAARDACACSTSRRPKAANSSTSSSSTSGRARSRAITCPTRSSSRRRFGMIPKENVGDGA